MTARKKTAVASPLALVTNPRTGAGDEYDHSGNFEISEHNCKHNRKQYGLVYDNDALVQQAIHTPVVDSLTNWREITDAALKKADTDLQVKQTMLKAAAKARLYGQSMIVPILTDERGFKIGLNRKLENIEGVRKINRLMVVDDFGLGDVIDKNVLSDNHGNPTKYTINEKAVDASRVIIVDGSVTGKSFLDGIMVYFKNFHRAYAEMIRGTEEANIPVLATDTNALENQAASRKAAGISTTDYEEILQDRARNFRSNNNSRNAHIIDKNREAVLNVAKNNIGDIVKAAEAAADFLCSAVDIPASRFLGKQYGSLASSSTSDIQNYIQILSSMRTLVLEKPISALDMFIAKTDDKVNSFDYEWNDLPMERFLDTGATNASAVD